MTPPEALQYHLTYPGLWDRGRQAVDLRVRHADGEEENLPAFAWQSLAVHPTQVYESISMFLLVFFLLSYYPLKMHDGSVLVFMMIGYGLQRFLLEMLRSDTRDMGIGLTLSQVLSLVTILGAGVLGYFVWRRPANRRVATAQEG